MTPGEPAEDMMMRRARAFAQFTAGRRGLPGEAQPGSYRVVATMDGESIERHFDDHSDAATAFHAMRRAGLDALDSLTLEELGDSGWETRSTMGLGLRQLARRVGVMKELMDRDRAASTGGN
ncbi:MAG TPA: hypothetical protein VFP54_10950 [Acidimicrobiales bacterium]|nr:hypothetical protein [Acidimicrobiales bacterium]